MKAKLTPNSIIVGSLLSTTLLSAGLLMSVRSFADNETTVDQVEITVPVACTMTGSGQSSHTATLNPGTYSGASGSEYENGIGKTTMTTFCNDNNGFSIYAIGFTGDTNGNNTLVGTSASSGAIINTKAYESTDSTSNWSMMVNKVENPSQGTPITWKPENMTITNGFSSWHAVPSEYSKVVEYKSTTEPATTDTTLGAKFETTYAAYVSTTQPADTYIGKVKYVMVHPSTAPAPFIPHEIECEAETICYNVNADPAETEGSMNNQSLNNIDWSSCYSTDYSTDCYNDHYQSVDIATLPRLEQYTATLAASNYSRPNYGFAGWNTAYDYSGTNYGPTETITLDSSIAENGLSLYAIWVPVARDSNDNELTFQTPNFKTITLKDGETLNDKQNGYVTALRDIRDDDVYAIAKLADGQYWMIENLRLDNTANITTSNTQSNNGSWGGVFIGLAGPEPLSNFYSLPVVPNSLYGPDSITGDYRQDRFPRYNNDNTTRVNNGFPYSYGNLYTWAAAVADTSSYYNYSPDFYATVESTSICPSGWRLPSGNTYHNNGDYVTLHTAMGNNAYDAAASQKWREYPNDFLIDSKYHTSTVYSNIYDGSYSPVSVDIRKDTMIINNVSGSTIRCIAQ